jgi:hypothetical protein
MSHCLKSSDDLYHARKHIESMDRDVVARRSVLASIPSFAAIGIFRPERVSARAGEPAKVKGVGDFAADFMGCQDERTNGCRDGRTEKSVYEQESAGIISARSVRINSEWTKLEAQVDTGDSSSKTVIISAQVMLRRPFTGRQCTGAWQLHRCRHRSRTAPWHVRDATPLWLQLSRISLYLALSLSRAPQSMYTEAAHFTEAEAGRHGIRVRT